MRKVVGYVNIGSKSLRKNDVRVCIMKVYFGNIIVTS
jgi:hypothetical protein